MRGADCDTKEGEFGKEAAEDNEQYFNSAV